MRPLSAPIQVCRSFADALLAERQRWVVWFPVMLGCGIGLYFAQGEEPVSMVAILALVLALAVALVTHWRWPGWGVAAWVLLVAPALGFAAGFAPPAARRSPPHPAPA